MYDCVPEIIWHLAGMSFFFGLAFKEIQIEVLIQPKKNGSTLLLFCVDGQEHFRFSKHYLSRDMQRGQS